MRNTTSYSIFLVKWTKRASPVFFPTPICVLVLLGVHSEMTEFPVMPKSSVTFHLREQVEYLLVTDGELLVSPKEIDVIGFAARIKVVRTQVDYESILCSTQHL